LQTQVAVAAVAGDITPVPLAVLAALVLLSFVTPHTWPKQHQQLDHQKLTLQADGACISSLHPAQLHSEVLWHKVYSH
jgi:hypothetical protein